jgi:hypothetical protein
VRYGHTGDRRQRQALASSDDAIRHSADDMGGGRKWLVALYGHLDQQAADRGCGIVLAQCVSSLRVMRYLVVAPLLARWIVESARSHKWQPRPPKGCRVCACRAAQRLPLPS